MDPISTLGLVANIFEVISFTSDLVSAGNNIYRSQNGLQDKNVTVDELATDLRKLTLGLSESQDKWVHAHEGARLDADEIRLRNICERCNETATELSVQLQKLKVQEGTRFRRLKSYRQAIISVWKEDEVNKVAARLKEYQDSLEIHILVGLRKSAQESDIRLSARFAQLDQKLQEAILAILDRDQKLDSRLDDQTELLGRVYENTNQLLTIGRVPSPVPPYEETPGGPRATPLHEAAAAGDLPALKKALRSWGMDVNARDEDGCTPLHVAATGDIARRLIVEEKLRLNAEDDEGRSALHCAVLKRHLPVIKVLLEAGIDQSLEDDYGQKAAFYAQDCNAARWMLKYGPDPEAIAKDHLDNTGLCHMAWLGDLEGTQFFIDQGGNVNAKNQKSETALTESSRHGNLEVVKLLLQHRADIEAALDGGWRPLLQAVRDNRIEVVKELLAWGANKHAAKAGGLDAVAEAVYRGHNEIARLLIERGARLESTNHFGRTLLLETSRRREDDGEFMHFLLQRGAKPGVQDRDGRNGVWHAANGGHHRVLAALLEYKCPTGVFDKANWHPLGCAAHHGFDKCVRLLLDAGAEIDRHQAHNSEYTALCEAAHHGHVKVVELLTQRGANMEIGSKSGFGALSIAAHNGQDAVVRVLAEAGANLNSTGFTNKDLSNSHVPIMRAIAASKTSTALLLIELGAELDSRDAEGRTPLIFAVEKNNATVARTLVSKGANVNLQTFNRNETALFCAAVRGNVEIVTLLLEARASTRLRDWRGCTAWVVAKQFNNDRKLEALLGPGRVDDEESILRKLQEEGKPADVAKYLSKANQ